MEWTVMNFEHGKYLSFEFWIPFYFLFYTFTFNILHIIRKQNFFLVGCCCISIFRDLFLSCFENFGFWLIVSCVECYMKMELICYMYNIPAEKSVFHLPCHVSLIFSMSKVFGVEPNMKKQLRECVSIFKKFEYFELNRLWDAANMCAIRVEEPDPTLMVPRLGLGQKQFEWNNI